MKYRSDIDGLRAVAVLSVVVYHANPNWLSGGFVGVDIFFVISGFLITTLIAEEMSAGNFALSNFWMRRIRRILPAAYLVMASAAVLFAFVYPPDMYASFAKSLFAQSLFVGNMFFWQSAGYFEPASTLQPLLHTWSLAVEEQFYFFFPLILWLTHRFLPRAQFLLVAVLVLISLVLSVLATILKPEAAFYLIITRAWELGIGALLALFLLKYPTSAARQPRAAKAAVWLGILLLLVSITVFNELTSFPSYFATVPCIGAALLIWGGATGSSAKRNLLSNKIFVGIGLISYSLYLWHWVALTFVRALFVGPPPLWAILVAILFSFILAGLTYKLVEQPVRRNKALFTTGFTLAGTLAGFIILIGTSLFIIRSDGLPDRSPQAANLYVQARSVDRSCENRDIAKDGFCQLASNPNSTDIDYFFWGDSHMLTTHTMVQGFAQNNGFSAELATYNHCAPGLDLWRNDLSPEHNEACQRQAEKIVSHLIEQQIKNVVLIARFNFALNTPEPFEGKIAPYYGNSVASSIDAYTKSFLALTQRLKAEGITLHALRQVPNYGVDIPLAAYKMRNDTNLNLLRARADLNQRWAPFDRIAAEAGINIIDVTDTFCTPETCSPFKDGKTLYRDDHHVNFDGAAEMLASFNAQLLAGR